MPIQSAGPSIVPTQSPGPTLQPTTPISQPFQIMPDAYPSPYIYLNPYMFPFSSPMAGWNAWPGSSPFLISPSQQLTYRPLSHEAPLGSSSFYQSPSPYGIQTPPPWVMQTPPQSLFYQDGSSSQHPQLDLQPDEPQSPPEQPEPSPEPEPRRNPAYEEHGQSASLMKRFVYISTKRVFMEAFSTDVDKALPQGRALLANTLTSR
ncbi:hypothetical protein PVK06_021366 [Gossypium arboreum]|uniref:Uncharacterized protein n=1 Tax=Gossypium arboreum TaxID=29729 RepID=A0ABR0PPT1_GOSAR|nr:hypothetical protein PVK06_021366 [Gossypium arboreum]